MLSFNATSRVPPSQSFLKNFGATLRPPLGIFFAAGMTCPRCMATVYCAHSASLPSLKTPIMASVFLALAGSFMDTASSSGTLFGVDRPRRVISDFSSSKPYAYSSFGGSAEPELGPDACGRAPGRLAAAAGFLSTAGSPFTVSTTLSSTSSSSSSSASSSFSSFASSLPLSSSSSS